MMPMKKNKSNYNGDCQKKSPSSPNSVVLISSTVPPKVSVGQQQHGGSQRTDSLTTDDCSSLEEDFLALPPSLRRRSYSPSSSLTSHESPLILDEDDYHDAYDNKVLQEEEQQQEQPELSRIKDDKYHKNEAELTVVSKNILADVEDLAAIVETEAVLTPAKNQQFEDIETPSYSSRWTQHQLLMEYESQRKSKQNQRYETLKYEWQIYQGFLQRRYKKLVKGEQFVVSRRFSTVKDHLTRGKEVVKSTLWEAKRLGENIKTQLKTMEDQVTRNWSLYENIVTSDTYSSHTICVDGWMLELQYCAQVQYQLHLWNKILKELCTMFHFARQELSMYQEELFLLFHQQRISESIAMAYLGTTSEEDPPNQGITCIFADIENSNTKGSFPTANGVVPESPPSPMKSSLLVSSNIMERRNSDGCWTDTLAIVTVDSVLHFFHVPSEQSTKSPQEILNQTLLSLSLELLTPSLSIYIPNCSHCHKAQNVSSTHCEALEITEAYLDSNGCFTTRKILLRTTSPVDTMKWSKNVFVTC